ncbi:MAG: DNA-3-methyladenine glycosylase [bacterium]|nr:DNA-3-methyladenine glycosylase [Candidatus Sumerlaeota bacterium]
MNRITSNHPPADGHARPAGVSSNQPTGRAIVLDDAIDFSARFTDDFFTRSTPLVARALLGSILVHNAPEGLTAGRIAETEAYCGPHDRASHSCGNRLTQRNHAMFGAKGHAYIYLIYGMYWCFNIVSGPHGKPQAVLVRALEPILGMELMRARLGAPSHASAHSLCRGPGKLCRAMGITREHYEDDLNGTRLFLAPASHPACKRVTVTPRINIQYAGAYAHKPWRYFITGNPCVSQTGKNTRT